MRSLTLHTIRRPWWLLVPLLLAGPQDAVAQAGTLDPTFGDTGIVLTGFADRTNGEYGYAVTISDSDDKIVVGGHTYVAGRGGDFGVARLNPDGSLDDSFGSGGMVAADFYGELDIVHDIALYPDGKVVAVGYVMRPVPGIGLESEVGVARFTRDGSLDATFGGDGRVTTHLPCPESVGGYRLYCNIAYGVAIQSDGKVVVAGRADHPTDAFDIWDLFIIRYDLDGSLDQSFGTGGIVIHDFGHRLDYATDVSVMQDGKILVLTQVASVGRFNADGTPDNSFGDLGYGRSSLVNNMATYAMDLQIDGSIVIGGADWYPEPGYVPAVAQLTPDGLIDTSFGTDGHTIIMTDFGTHFQDLAVMPDGDIALLAGKYLGVHLFRLDADGSMNTVFGSGGVVFDTYATGSALASQADGRVVVAGWRATGGANRYDFMAARYHGDGSLDASFDSDGWTIIDFLIPREDEAKDVVEIMADGRVVAAGPTYWSATGYDAGIARYNADGSADLSFGGNGVVSVDLGSYDDDVAAIAARSDNRLLVAGTGAGDFAVAYIGTSGYLYAVNTTDLGSDHDAARAIAVLSDNRFILAGETFGPVDMDFAVVRYNADLSLDASFGTGGIVRTDFVGSNDRPRDVAIQPDGKIVVAGSSEDGSVDFALARYNVDGSLDATFGSGGLVRTDLGSAFDVAYGLGLQPDGKIVLGGYTLGPTSYDFAAVRYNSDGTLDASFDGDGIATVDFGGDDFAYDLGLQADGQIVLGGRSGDDFALARLLPTGSLDIWFGDYGIVTTDLGSVDQANAVAIQADAKILVAGYTYNYETRTNDFAVARYDGVGAPDCGLLSIIAQVEALVQAGRLNNGQGNALLVKLQGAIQQLDRANTTPAINKLEAFMNQVDAFVEAGILTVEEGQILNDCAARMIAQLTMGKLAGDSPKVEVLQAEVLPTTFGLSGNYPNPFNPSTTLAFDLPEESEVDLRVYNVLGREVGVLADAVMPAGTHRVTFEAGDLPSGMYIARLETELSTFTARMTLVK